MATDSNRFKRFANKCQSRLSDEISMKIDVSAFGHFSYFSRPEVPSIPRKCFLAGPTLTMRTSDAQVPERDRSADSRRPR